MSSERDIEDILNSLNELLREGESYNDDHSVAEPRREKVSPPRAEKRDDRLPAKTAVKAEPEKLVEVRAEAVRPASPVVDEPVKSKAKRSDDAPVSVPRVVLTEDMMLDNPQGNLLSLVRNPEEPQPQPAVKEAKPAAKGGSVRVDQNHMGRLVRQISDDVIRRLEKELPGLIAESIRRHLKELKRDD